MFDKIKEKIRGFFIEPIRRETIEQERRDLIARGPMNPSTLRQLERIEKRLAAWKYDDAYRAEQRRSVKVDQRLLNDPKVSYTLAPNQREGGMQVEYHRETAAIITPSNGKRNDPYLIDHGDSVNIRSFDRESLRDAVRISKERYGREGMEIGGNAHDPDVRKILAECVRQGVKVSGTAEMRAAYREVRTETLREMRQEAREIKANMRDVSEKQKAGFTVTRAGEERIATLTKQSIVPLERIVLTTDKAERDLVLRDMARSGLRPHKPDAELKAAWKAALNEVAAERNPTLAKRIAEVRSLEHNTQAFNQKEQVRKTELAV